MPRTEDEELALALAMSAEVSVHKKYMEETAGKNVCRRLPRTGDEELALALAMSAEVRVIGMI